MEPLSPIQELDFILNFLAINIKAKPGISLDNLFKESKRLKPELDKEGIIQDWGSRLRRILNKLEKDDLIIQGVHGYEITFDGYLKNLKGGYEGKINRRNADKNRIDELEASHREMNRTLNKWTMWIAIGTGALALFTLLTLLLMYFGR